ncbi:MAG: HlyD family efflux transporter periplasmic adaptor subunit [Phycisphaerae bacterium]|jgi:multidrug efflux pump subunit AcrA (membrane-fusion protein)
MLSMHTSWTRPLLVAVLAIWPQSVLEATPRDPHSCTPARLGDVSAAPGEVALPGVSAPDEQNVQRGYIGIVLPRRALEVTAELQLRLKAVHVDLGDQLDPKDPHTLIAELDTVMIEHERKIAEESVNLARLQAGIAEAKANAARELRKIIRELRDRLEASKWEVYESDLQVAIAEAEVRRAETAVEQQVARIQQLNHELACGAIRAPSEEDAPRFYIVAARYRNPGDLVGPGIPIVRLISEESFIRFAVEPPDAAQLKEGDTVQVDVPDLSRTFSARVERIAPEVHAASGRVAIEAGFVAPALPGASKARAPTTVKAGMVVRVHVHCARP